MSFSFLPRWKFTDNCGRPHSLEFLSHGRGCMIQTSLAKRIALAAAGGLVSCLLAATAGSAAEIRVLTSVALTSALNQIAPNFEQATGNKLNIGYSLIADIRKRILDGETADVIILSRPVMDELDKQQKFASGSIINVAGTPVALVRQNRTSARSMH